MTESSALPTVRPHWRQWLPILGTVGLAQAGVQLAGLVLGIFTVRRLATADFALYTLAYATLGTIGVLADGGVASGVMAEGGKVWQDRIKLGSVLATGLALRRRFAIATLFIAFPFLAFLLHSHGASWPYALGLMVVTATMFIFALSSVIYEIAIKLHQAIHQDQRISAEQAGIRLGLGLGVLGLVPNGLLVMLTASLSQIWSNRRMRQVAGQLADLNQPEDPATRGAVLKLVRRVMPGAIYFALSGQINVWLISIFGSTRAVADIGALARLAQMLTLVGVLVNLLVLPRFARLPEHRPRLIRIYAAIVTGTGLIAAGVVTFAWVFPQLAVWLFGQKYAGIESEVVWMCASACTGMLAGVVYGLGAARGWVANQMITLPIVILLQAALIPWLDFSRLRGVILFGLAGGALQLITHLGYGIHRLRQAAA